MSCYTPNLRVEDTSKYEIAKDGHKYHPAFITSTKNLEEVGKYNHITKYKTQIIPCGRCIGCRLDYTRDWANRGYLEMLTHEKETCWFITLTYNDKYLPKHEEIEYDGITYTEPEEINWNGYLIPRDLQLFLKRLRRTMERKYQNKGIKFMACGEYGTKEKRPHYHLILFGCKLPTESFYNPRIDWKKDIYYQNTIIEECWREEKTKKFKEEYSLGISNICEANWQTISYVARYITKKIYGKESNTTYGLLGQTKEFFRASNRNAIGYEYYKTHKNEIYKKDQISIKHKDKIVYCKPPKYFDILYERENPKEFQKIKEKRQKDLKKSIKLKAIRVDHSQWNQLQIEKRTKETAAKTLIRPLEI